MLLLLYIGDAGLREVIHAETNKSEQFNSFAGCSFLGGEGIVAENSIINSARFRDYA